MAETEGDGIPIWWSGEKWCPITGTAKLIGRKWHPVIIHRLLENGSSGFSELLSDIDGISNKVLSDSLDDLEEKGLVKREITNEKPVRVRYSLTERGESLMPVIDAMYEWGNSHLVAADSKEQSVI